MTWDLGLSWLLQLDVRPTWVVGVVLVILTIWWLAPRADSEEHPEDHHHPSFLAYGEGKSNGSLPSAEEPHVNIINAAPTWPRNVVYRNNAPEPCPFDSTVCHGSFLALHRPTYDKRRMDSASYPYADHMHGRKRLWEFRLQISFREPVQGQVFVGVEQYCYQKVGVAQQHTASFLIKALQRATGGLYQSYGDDPDTTEGEVERPHMVFPLGTMMDQLIITQPGEQPPDLTDPKFSKLGLTKANDRGAFKRAIDDLDLVPGPTFTFGFWGIAQFLDTILWRAPARGVMPEIKLTKIGILPPGFMVMYCLDGEVQSQQSGGDVFLSPPSSPVRKPKSIITRSSSTSSVVPDGRHLDSRKVYLWRTAFWSTLVPPDPVRMRDILAEVREEEETRSRPSKSKAGTQAGMVRHRWCCGI